MHFKRKNIFSDFKRDAHSQIITISDLNLMFQNEYLFEKSAYFIADHDQSSQSLTSHLNHINELPPVLKKALLDSKTIIIKELEFWSIAVRQKCNEIGNNPNVHLYYSPPMGTSFDWHADDRDVLILMQEGEKLFEVEEPDQSISRYVLTKGSELFIPYGAKHRAMATDQSSLHLSFGIWPSEILISSDYQTYDLGIKL